MKSLFINTSSQLLELSFKNEDKIEAYVMEEGKSQSEVIIDAISSLLRDIKISDLDFIAVVSGPGSFTGIRLGLSIVKGFLIGVGVPVIGIDNFEAYYYSYQKPEIVEYMVALSAGGSEVYFSKLDKNGAGVVEPVICPVENLEKAGEKSDTLYLCNFDNNLNFFVLPIKPDNILIRLEKEFNKKNFIQPELEALYIKPHYAKIKSRQE